MARTPGSRAEITGPLVREAARDLFARHGYAAVSMRQIAAAVGVQAGTLYSYTPDKQALLADLLREHMEALLSAWGAQSGLDTDPVARLDRFVRFHIGYSLDHPEGVFLSYMELRNLSAENHRSVSRLRREYENELQAILDAGAGSGRMHVPDTRLAAMALIAMLTGVTNWYRTGGRLDRDRLCDLYAGLARGAVGA